MTDPSPTPPERAGASASDALALDPALPDLAVLHDAYCLPTLCARTFSPEELWRLLAAIVDESPDIRIDEAPPRSVAFGAGPTRVLLWSRGSVDDAAHAMALADLFAYWRREPDDARVAKLRRALTVVAVPLLNADGDARMVPDERFGGAGPHFVLGPGPSLRAVEGPGQEGEEGDRLRRRAAFIATLTALEAIAEGSYTEVSPAPYEPLQDGEAPAR